MSCFSSSWSSWQSSSLVSFLLPCEIFRHIMLNTVSSIELVSLQSSIHSCHTHPRASRIRFHAETPGSRLVKTDLRGCRKKRPAGSMLLPRLVREFPSHPFSLMIFSWNHMKPSFKNEGWTINGGNPERMVYKGTSYQNAWMRGTPIYGNLHFLTLKCHLFNLLVITATEFPVADTAGPCDTGTFQVTGVPKMPKSVQPGW